MELTVAIRGTADADGWTAWAERDAYDPSPTLVVHCGNGF
jgi:hypothetical protein